VRDGARALDRSGAALARCDRLSIHVIDVVDQALSMSAIETMNLCALATSARIAPLTNAAFGATTQRLTATTRMETTSE
jgi:hypothetical protein